MEQSTRIPLRLEFDDSFRHREEFVERVVKTGMFSLKKVNRSYFSSIVESILKDEDPMPIIRETEPEIDGVPHMSLLVREASFFHSQSIVFVYSSAMSEEVFSHRCMEALCAFRARNRRVILKNTGLYAIRTLFGTSDASRKELADAYFMDGNYESALYMYTRTSSMGVCRRMSEICRALVGADMLGDPLAFDVAIFHRRFDVLYAAVEALPFDAKMAAQYYLVKQEMSQHMRVLLEYGCCKGFTIIGDRQRLSSVLCSLKRFVSCEGALASSTRAGSSFWDDCRRALDFEFGDGPDGAKNH